MTTYRYNYYSNKYLVNLFKKEKRPQNELDEIKLILQKTILPDEISEYIIEEFINTNEKCKMCHKKNETFKICEKCNNKHCQNCTLTKEFKKKHNVCKKCYPEITDIHDLYKNVCECCTYCDNYKENYHSCEMCNKISCHNCYFVRFCWKCYYTLDDSTIDISNEEDYSRCDECNYITHNYDLYECKMCNKNYCDSCRKNCDDCEDYLCNDCITEYNDTYYC